ncbi:hypothetical protein C8F04DRAFT_1073750 [Mycena alexandri]|uniref:Uncharacterized protein n=1 Tax=Mycena alexandri TaxID=1745969 RepID=A0AAD6TBI5_9AGAR|nr:hypothetical protein C8F04DRAFT_1073750 [Mycena alexandri]
MPRTLLNTYIPIIVFPVLSALCLKLITQNLDVAAGLTPHLQGQCSPTSPEESPYRITYTGGAVDVAICGFVAFFHLALTPTVRPLLTYFLGTSLPLLALPALEAHRAGRRASTRGPVILSLPVLVSLAGQVFTVGAVLPLYWLIFILSGTASATPTSSTKISSAHAQATAFSLLIGVAVPSACLLFLSDPHVTALWQLFPLYQFFAYRVHLRVRPPQANSGGDGFGWVQALYLSSFIAGSSTHLGTIASPSVASVFLPRMGAPGIGVAPELLVLDVLQWDSIFAFGSTMLATLWFAHTTCQALTIALWNVVGSVVVGPGAAIAAVALWRESYLHTKVAERKQ